MSEWIRRRVVISGRVQGVGYRAACAKVARGLGLSGSVRNLDDGNVEAVAVGPPSVVGQFTAWCRQGPRLAQVDRVTVTDEPAAAPEGAPALSFRVVN